MTGLKDSDDYIISAWSDTHAAVFYYAIPKTELPENYIPNYSAMNRINATLVQPTVPYLTNIDLISDFSSLIWEPLHNNICFKIVFYFCKKTL